jgi:beta-lactamase class A
MTPTHSARRRVLAGLALASLGLLGIRPSNARAGAQAGAGARMGAHRGQRGSRFLARVAAIEAASGGRLGVAVHGSGDGIHLGYRMDERFLLCSTFKVLAAGFVLQRVRDGKERLERAIPVRAGDIVSHSPVTEKAVGATMMIAALCEATVTVSDNAAANLLFGTFGGPHALTAFLRGLGDPVTRLDRTETALNAWAPQAPDWDTTTPGALARTLATLLDGRTLGADGTRRLSAWLQGASTGLDRIRAGLPSRWHVGDKTGTGPTSTNDVAWIDGPRGGPFALAVYYADAPGDGAAQNAVIAAVARAFATLDVEAAATRA